MLVAMEAAIIELKVYLLLLIRIRLDKVIKTEQHN
jgi:hypothetical protein